MRKPNLFIVGAPKCGTTAWVNYLSRHSEIYFSDIKEPHFFSDDFLNYPWVKTVDEYVELFKGSKSETIVGEGSVRYLYSKVAAQKIFDFNPTAKILIFLRTSSKFIYSYHNQVLVNGEEDISDLELAWRLSVSGTRKKFPSNCRDECFLDYAKIGQFSEQIQRYIEVFPSQNIRIIHFEDWVKNPQLTYEAILKFLGLESDGEQAFEKIHGAKNLRSPWLTQFISHPPQWLRRLVGISKKVTGRKSFNVAHKILEANKAEGYLNPLPEALSEEIEAYFEQDAKKTSNIIRQYGVGLTFEP